MTLDFNARRVYSKSAWHVTMMHEVFGYVCLINSTSSRPFSPGISISHNTRSTWCCARSSLAEAPSWAVNTSENPYLTQSTRFFNAFNARTERYNLLYLINKNKMFIMIFMFVCLIQIIFIYYGGSIFRTYGLTFIELAKILLISFTVIPVDLLRKWFYKSKYNSDTF